MLLLGLEALLLLEQLALQLLLARLLLRLRLRLGPAVLQLGRRGRRAPLLALLLFERRSG
jgi:hypothetical protein